MTLDFSKFFLFGAIALGISFTGQSLKLEGIISELHLLLIGGCSMLIVLIGMTQGVSKGETEDI